MNKTALNLIAISVFMMTMSVLLGPAINLPPAVPAIAVFTLLGIATLDSFRFEGKGGTLLLGLLANLSAEHRSRVVRHEAGHFLVAYLLEIPINGYTLSPWEAFQQKQSGVGGVSFSDAELASQLKEGKLSAQLFDRYSAVWMAGGVAETLVYGNAEGGADDLQKLRSIWTQQLGRNLAECTAKERSAALQARTLIKQNWSAYEALVAAMAEGNSVSYCYDIIKQNG